MREDLLTLFPDDVEALRRASGIVFFADSEGRAKIRAILEKNDPADFSAVEARIFRNVRWEDGKERVREFRVNGYARNTSGLMGYASPLDGKRLIGSYYEMSGRYSPSWQTIARTVKPGQAIELTFLADHSRNENIRKVNYHADDFLIRVHDREGRIKQFLIDVCVGPHDSARMIRAEGDPSQLTTNFSIDDYWDDVA